MYPHVILLYMAIAVYKAYYVIIDALQGLPQ